MRANKRARKKNSRQFNQRFRGRFLTMRAGIIALFTVLIFAVILVCFLRIRQRASDYQKTINELSTEIQQLKETNNRLEEEMDNINSDEYIEKTARERLGMVKEGEYILKQSKESTEE